MFPLYKNNGVSIVALSGGQKKLRDDIIKKISTFEYVLKDNECLCRTQRNHADITIAEKDRYGLPISNILCTSCGLIRSGKVFDEISSTKFYENEYRKLYGSAETSLEQFFLSQSKKGENFLVKVGKSFLSSLPGNRCFEIGCGAGGVLMPFKNMGLSCSGCDFNRDYLEYGRRFGLDLRYGNYESLISDRSVDFIILSHIFEHFLDPFNELIKICKKLKKGGFILLEVPGVFSIYRDYHNLLSYFQNAHIFNYYGGYLIEILQAFGFKIYYGDEKCTFLVQKNRELDEQDIKNIDFGKLRKYSSKVIRHLLVTHFTYNLFLQPYRWKIAVLKIVRLFKHSS